VPCATRLDVQTIATAAASICRRPTVVSKITKHRQKQVAEKMAARLQMEEKEAQDRTPDQWKKMIADKRSELEEKVGKLMEQLLKVEEEKKQMQSQNEKYRKRARRKKLSITSEDGEQSTEYIGRDGEVVWEQCLTLLSNVGGISRLTVFNDDWHSKHHEGARLLWGYNSWREAKLYVNVFLE